MYLFFRSVTLLFFLLSFCQLNYGQRFGGNRPSFKWRQIKTDTTLVIFPASLERQATEVASLVRYMAKNNNATLGEGLRRVPIILQNQPVIANGYVSLAPFRSEFFMNPPAGNLDLGTLPWHQQLLIHEYRHIQQYNNFKKGLSAAGAFVLGQEGQALLNAIAVPDWFFEGDAVFYETMLTKQGRGRIPYFFNEFKLLNNANISFSYMQLRNGSYRHMYPNHYKLGYLLVEHGYSRYGSDFWRNVTDDAVRFKGLFYPFQKAVKKRSGSSFENLVGESITAFNSRSAVPVLATEKRERFVRNALLPQPVGIDSVVWLQKSYRQVPGFYLQVNNQQKKIKLRQIGNDDYFSQNNGKIVYTRYGVHPRWSWTEYSDIVLLDVNSRKETRVTKGQRYFSPDISTNGERIIVVENKTSGENSLKLLAVADGSVVSTIDFPYSLLNGGKNQDGTFTFPKFAGDSVVVAGLRFPNGMSALASFAIDLKEWKLLTTPSYQVFSAPQMGENFIYTNMSLDGRDRIVRIHTTDGKMEKLIENELIYAPATDGKSLHFSRHSINGMTKGAADLSALQWQPVIQQDWGMNSSSMSINNYNDQPLETAVSDSFTVSAYRKTSRFFNFHSWRPYFSEPDLSFTLYGQNVLNTFRSELVYKYNTNENTHSAGFAALYGAWFPYLRGNVEYTVNRNAIIDSIPLQWNELTASAGVQVPLQFTGGRYYRNLSASASINNQSVFYRQNAHLTSGNIRFNYLRASLSYGAQIQQALQHIYPRFAHSLLLDYRTAVDNLRAKQLLASAYVYLPGVHVNHNFVLNIAYQQRDNERNYRFTNSFPVARGYTGANFYKMYKAGVNYHFPLAYPDWGIANMVYFMRVRPNIFFDFSRIADNFQVAQSVRYLEFNKRSAGVELFFDTKWWNQLPVSFGLRYSRLLDQDLFGRKPNQFEFVMPVNLF